MPAEFHAMQASLHKAHPAWSKEEVDKRAAMTFGSVFGTNPQHAEKLESEGKWESYKQANSKKDKKEISRYFSFVPGFSLKEEGGTYYAEGFISDPSEDLGHDIVEDQSKLVNKINAGNAVATKLSYRHDWLKGKDAESSDNEFLQPPPFGVLAAPAELKTNPISGMPAAWAKYKLNSFYPEFEKKIAQIAEGHVNGFSIEYEVSPDGARYEQYGNVKRRYINDYTLLGVGVAARPMQPNAVMSGFYAKEYEMTDGADYQERLEGREIEVTRKLYDRKDAGRNLPDEEHKRHEDSETRRMERNEHMAEGTPEKEHEDANGTGPAHPFESSNYYQNQSELDLKKKKEDAEKDKSKPFNDEEGKEIHANLGSAAARQESAKRQGGNTMETKEAELRTQLEKNEAEIKELKSQLSIVASLKEDYEAFKKESASKVLANAAVKEAVVSTKEVEAKEFDRMMAQYKEKPSWDAASALLQKVGGPLNI